MHPDSVKLVKLMFNEDEHICVQNSKFAYRSIPFHTLISEPKITLIPNDPEQAKKYTRAVDASKLILMSLNPMKENATRHDSSVASYRSFLIELDVGSIKEQLGTIAHLKMPFSAQTFSGSKSVHTVITLDEDLPNEKAYRAIGEWIFNIVTLADKNCANPTRSVRLPGVYREPGKKQRLIKINRRISHKELMNWLNKYIHLKPSTPKKREVPSDQPDFSRLSIWVKVMMKKGMDFNNRGRNQTWYAVAYDFALAGFSEDQTVEILNQRFEEEPDFREKEFLRTIKSAFEKVTGEKK